MSGDRRMRISKYRWAAWFVGGVLCGAVLLGSILAAGGWSVVSGEEARERQSRLSQLQSEIERLRAAAASPAAPRELPYDEAADARALVAEARRAAIEQDRFLMVTFGANWCMDCRTLHRHLKSPEVASYTDGVFRFANVDVGKFNRNRALAEELGVDLSRGIPVAIFFDRRGEVIGTTNDGQLEPARRYSSKQILRFMRDIAEQSRVTEPDSVLP